jgi:4-amino-4-deoxy-L-arabinose transferase-like glycosyltransferase
MSSSPSRPDPGARREVLIVAAMTLIGGLLRSWSIGRLGLVHFDEGIYAMAGTWVLSPWGLGGLDPTVISYAPPGFPILVGLSYGLLGVTDVSAILVSILAGTLTIPLVAWLALRTFGRGAAAAASAFAALSGSHIAFSRMALTDVSFALCWLIAIGQGQRFLDRPGPARAIGLGFAVGAAQLFKYNGWIAGAVVVVAALIGPLLTREERFVRRQKAVWGWGPLAATVAAGVYWPWFRFVEAHGGYAALLAHQRGYMGGLSSWPRHTFVLFQQDDALSGGALWLATGAFVAAVGLNVAIGGPPDVHPRPARLGLALAGFTALCAYPGSNWYGPLFWLGFSNPLTARRLDLKTNHFLVIAWTILALMTPFYHPYARLLIPLQALSWVLMGGAFAFIQRGLDRLSRKSGRAVLGMPRPWIGFALICGLVPIVFSLLRVDYSAEARLGPLLEPSDSLRHACRMVTNDLPKDLGSLRLYARPPVAFYLGAGVSVAPQPALDPLFAPGDPKAWALLDAAMVKQGGGVPGRFGNSTDRWELADEIPSTLNWPTLLDIDPSAAMARSPDRSAPMFLFRPKRPGAAR